MPLNLVSLNFAKFVNKWNNGIMYVHKCNVRYTALLMGTIDVIEGNKDGQTCVQTYLCHIA